MIKLTILKALNRIRLMYLIRYHLTIQKISLSDAKNIVDNLPWSTETFLPKEEISPFLNDVATFSIEDVVPIYEPKFRPPWQTPEYLAARQWYSSLSEDDRKKIDILVNANVAWA